MAMNRLIAVFIAYVLLISAVGAQVECRPINQASPLSTRLANYKMHLVMDGDKHFVDGSSIISWLNSSPDTVYQVPLYMYLNAFKNNKTSYLRPGSSRMPMGDLDSRPAEEWGWIRVVSSHQDGTVGQLEQRYIQPNDGNPHDETVLLLTLNEPVYPGEELRLSLQYEAKLPRIISRVGYAAHSFHHWVHSYPKVGVYEQDIKGNWGWNCHQFLPHMEFYGDHGNYDVTIEVPSEYVIGASGCLTSRTDTQGRSIHRFLAEDVIDFGWVASPHLRVYQDQWEHVEIRYLYPDAHEGLRERLVGAAKHALEYLNEHVGSYPYTTLTILDPPLYALRSGFMEYPNYVTGGAFHGWPRALRSIESLIIHEVSHQYFMQILASNEKEEPWLDEGFVTFYEDRIMEAAYGGESSLSEAWGYLIPNSAFTRNEYVSLPNPRVSPIAVPSWEVNDAYKGIVYSKTATVLQTIEAHLGVEEFDEMMQRYFARHKFTHPRKADFVAVLNAAFEKSHSYLKDVLPQFIQQALDGTEVCDYAVRSISNAPLQDGTGWFANGGVDVYRRSDPHPDYFTTVRLERLGDFIMPVEVLLTWEDGDTEMIIWDGIASVENIERTHGSKLKSVEIDPYRRVALDIDINNNSKTLSPKTIGIWKYTLRAIYWVQNALQVTNILM